MRRALISLTALAVATAGLVTTAPTAAAANGRIALVSGREANQTGLFEVWSVASATDPAAANETHAAEAVDVDPSWHPTLDSFVFARQTKNDETFDLFIKDANGISPITSGAPSDRQPDWSAAGIAFTRTNRGESTSNIYRVNQSGGGLTQLTSTPAPGYDAGPAWSPDGAQIAFTSDRAGGIPQIFTMDAGGVTETQRTTDGCFATNPAWLSNTVIVYERQCPGDDADIYRLDLITLANTPLFVSGSSDHQPAVSPDLMQVAFTRIEPDGDKDVYVTPVAQPAPQTPIAGNSNQADMAADWGSVTAAPRDADAAAVPPVAVPTSGAERSAEAEPARAPKKKKKKGKKRNRKERFRVSPGVKYREFRSARSDAYLLTVDPKSQATLDVELARERLPGRERTSKMAKRNGAVAAVNGDFGMPPAGQPSHTFAEDGHLQQLSFAVAWNFAVAQNEQRTFFDRPFETVTAVDPTDDWRVERWNFGPQAYNDIAGWTAVGGNLETPPGNACGAKLAPVGGPRWAAGMMGVTTSYTVSSVGCQSAPFTVNGGAVLTARPGTDGAILLTSLAPGETIDVTWSLGWERVADSLGGTPLLVKDSAVVAKACNESICGKHPRTAVGVTAAGKILLLVVDGRSKRSKGVTTVRLAKIMRSLGAVFALNLDGGGSSTMVVRGKVKNIPSDGRQRRVSSAILVLDGPDGGEAIGDPAPRLAPALAGPTPDDLAALLDPASTGGLLEALAEGTFGPEVDLPPMLDRALQKFDARG